MGIRTWIRGVPAHAGQWKEHGLWGLGHGLGVCRRAQDTLFRAHAGEQGVRSLKGLSGGYEGVATIN